MNSSVESKIFQGEQESESKDEPKDYDISKNRKCKKKT